MNPNFEKKVVAKAMAQQKIKIKNALGRYQCSEHGSIPSVSFKDKPDGSFTAEISACCQKAVDRAKEGILGRR